MQFWEKLGERIKKGWFEWVYKRDLGKVPWHSEEPQEELVRLIEERKMPYGKVLDVGCGAGTNSVYLASQGFSVVGIDLARNALEHARKRVLKRGLSCFFIQGDIRRINFKEKFDLVLDRGCFHGFKGKDRETYVENLNHFLKEGGYFLLSCFSPGGRFRMNLLPPYGISRREIEKLFSPYLRMVSVKTGETVMLPLRRLKMTIYFMRKRSDYTDYE